MTVFRCPPLHPRSHCTPRPRQPQVYDWAREVDGEWCGDADPCPPAGIERDWLEVG